MFTSMGGHYNGDLMSASPILSLRGITKAFPGVIANDHVDLDVYRGEVHAVVGENGAGKSTLMKIVYGFYRADAGEIRVDDRLARIRSPHDARRLRIGMVFQDFVQVPALSVAENVALFLPDLPWLLDRREVAARIRTMASRYGLDVDPSALVWQLSVGERQKLEVIKLLLADAQVLILDEPTRSLAPHEVEGLFRSFDALRRDGYAVVFIAHKLREVLACADRITVMRRGKIAGALGSADASESALVRLMFGAGVAPAAHGPARTVTTAPPLLELRRVSTRAAGHATALDGIDLTIRPGEIVGVAGVSGNGQRELGDLILGLVPCAAGSKHLHGQDMTHWPVGRVRASGVAFIPEDALGMAAVPSMTALENMALGDTRRFARAGGLAMDWPAVRRDLESALARLQVTLPSLDVPSQTLSGGNVQRMILARETAHEPDLIVAFYPTRGLDLRSAIAARELLVASRDRGAGVLLISEDLDELVASSDRLAVLHRGRIVATRTPQDVTIEELGYLMTGSSGRT
jgi:simple sugar transport system ATP-binding protein